LLSQGAHGGDILAMARRLGCRVDELIDLSSNLTPLGPVPGLGEELAARLDEIAFLPEDGSETLTTLFAEKHGLAPAEVMAGNGTTEFIHAVPEAIRPKRALIVAPTYGDYLPAGHGAGLDPEFFFLKPEDDFALDLKRLSAALGGGELLFLCNPNNPTGRLSPCGTLREFIIRHPDTDFLVDESYLPFVSGPSLADFPLPGNLFLLCSFSKIYGIPGLRLGFLVAAGERLSGFAARRRPWGVNRPAQVAGEFLLRHGEDYARKVREFVARVRPGFAAALAAIPEVTVVAGETNFILCRLGGGKTAAGLREALLARRIMIRDCANFPGLGPDYFRVSLKDEEKNALFLKALAELLE